MKMRITVPAPVLMTQLDGSPVLDGVAPRRVTFVQFVRERTCDQRFTSEVGRESYVMEDVLAAVRVTEKCNAEPGSVVELELDDWERLRRATESPAPPGYHPAAARCCLPLMIAIVNAEREKVSA